MSETLLAFDKAVEPGDIALFFFAGHGFEIRGQNYLLPTDIPEVREGQEELIRDSAFPADRIIDRLQARGARTDGARARRLPQQSVRAAGRARAQGQRRARCDDACRGRIHHVLRWRQADCTRPAVQHDRASNSVFTRNLPPPAGGAGLDAGANCQAPANRSPAVGVQRRARPNAGLLRPGRRRDRTQLKRTHHPAARRHHHKPRPCSPMSKNAPPRPCRLLRPNL